MNSWVVCPVCRQTVTAYESVTISNTAGTARTDEVAPVELRIPDHMLPPRRVDYCPGSGRRAS